MAEKESTQLDGVKIDKNGNEYVSNQALLQQLIISQKQDKLTDEALEYLMLMIKRIQNKKYYEMPEDRKDCFQQAILDCLLYWRGFDPEKSNNPFGYFTSIISNGMAKGWNSTHSDIKKAQKALKTNKSEGVLFTSIDNNIYSI